MKGFIKSNLNFDIIIKNAKHAQLNTKIVRAALLKIIQYYTNAIQIFMFQQELLKNIDENLKKKKFAGIY